MRKHLATIVFLCSYLVTAIAVSRGSSDLSNCFLCFQNLFHTVQTSSGIVQGHVAAWPKSSTVQEFLGIPYAQPPFGQLRFAAPERFQSDNATVFVADKFSEDCVQYTGGASQNASIALQAYGYGMGGGSAADPHAYGEDCLTVNVWTKPTSDKKKAVMVWIYGGAYATGTSNAPFYNGARLAEDEDVIVASFNYRINIFGFPNAPGLPDENLGLLDQRLAVEWVRDNIAAFGGDPSRITLFGESAGAGSVDLYSYAWVDDPIVNGFIAQSGTAFLRIGNTDPTDYSSWYNVSQALGCGGAEVGEQTVQCVRGRDAADIINVVGTQAGGGLPSAFVPVADGKVVFADVRNRSAEGRFIKRPLLIGNNDFELGITIGIGSGILPGAPVGTNTTILQIGSDVAFTCPAARSAHDRAVNAVPVWRYRYLAVWDNVAVVPGMGAYHSSEIPIALGTNPLRPNATADTAEEEALERVMVHAWAAFAKDPEKGLAEELGWPEYRPNDTTLIRFGLNNQSTPDFAPSSQYDSLCSTLDP